MVGGTPSWGVPQPGLNGGGYPGYPLTRSGWWGVPRVPPTIKTWPGYPPPWDGVPPKTWNRVPPTIKTWLGYPPPWDWVPPTIKTWPEYPLRLGYPPPWDGVPPKIWNRVPPHHQDLTGVPPTLGWGTPHHQDLTRVSPQAGVPPTLGWGTHPPLTRQSSIARTCYAAGGMSLAFTQEDFLVINCFLCFPTSKVVLALVAFVFAFCRAVCSDLNVLYGVSQFINLLSHNLLRLPSVTWLPSDLTICQ